MSGICDCPLIPFIFYHIFSVSSSFLLCTYAEFFDFYLIVFGFGFGIIFQSLWEYWLDFFSSFFSSTSCFCFHGEYFVYFAILMLLFFFICPTDYKLFAHFKNRKYWVDFSRERIGFFLLYLHACFPYKNFPWVRRLTWPGLHLNHWGSRLLIRDY